jgi:hypothetical protein
MNTPTNSAVQKEMLTVCIETLREHEDWFKAFITYLIENHQTDSCPCDKCAVVKAIIGIVMVTAFPENAMIVRVPNDDGETKH